MHGPALSEVALASSNSGPSQSCWLKLGYNKCLIEDSVTSYANQSAHPFFLSAQSSIKYVDDHRTFISRMRWTGRLIFALVWMVFHISFYFEDECWRIMRVADFVLPVIASEWLIHVDEKWETLPFAGMFSSASSESRLLIAIGAGCLPFICDEDAVAHLFWL